MRNEGDVARRAAERAVLALMIAGVPTMAAADLQSVSSVHMSPVRATALAVRGSIRVLPGTQTDTATQVAAAQAIRARGGVKTRAAFWAPSG